MHLQPDRQTRSSRQQNMSQAERLGDDEHSWFEEVDNMWGAGGLDDWARGLGRHVVVDHLPDPQSQPRRTSGREHSLRLLSYDDDSRRHGRTWISDIIRRTSLVGIDPIAWSIIGARVAPVMKTSKRRGCSTWRGCGGCPNCGDGDGLQGTMCNYFQMFECRSY